MCATFLVVPPDDAEVKQVVGETQEIVRQVESRSEDVSFAQDLGMVLLDHVHRLAQATLRGDSSWSSLSRLWFQLFASQAVAGGSILGFSELWSLDRRRGE